MQNYVTPSSEWHFMWHILLQNQFIHLFQKLRLSEAQKIIHVILSLNTNKTILIWLFTINSLKYVCTHGRKNQRSTWL